MWWRQLLLALGLIGILSGAAARVPSASGWLLVANKGDNAMGIIDPAAAKQVAEVAEGGVTGHEIITSADGKLASGYLGPMAPI